MKYIFLISLATLVAASVGTWLWSPEAQSELPILYWVTDPNPARELQVERFHAWLRKNDYPAMELRLDTANNQQSKVIIQGVSGIGGDIFDMGGGTWLRQYQSIGLLADLTEWGRELGFSPDRTHAAIEPEITLDGRQYAFPCNVYCAMLWVNRGTFAKYGLEAPPRRWDVDEFERLGRQFVAATRQPGRRQMVFFVNHIDLSILRRSVGVSMYNETLTACTLDDPRHVEMLERYHRWTYVDHIMPSESDRLAFSAEAGYAGSTLQLFNSGNYAMFQMGRYALIQLRQFEPPLDLDVVEPPHGGFPNTSIGTRCAGIYAGGRHQQLAKYFLAFLASEEYNLNIVEDGDALPPNPAFTELPEFVRPAAYPNEWRCHEAFATAAREIGIAGAYSPFIIPAVASRIEGEERQAFMAGRQTAKATAANMARRINDEIQRNLEEFPKLRADYQRRLDRQRQIEARRAAGQPVPPEWIDNPFLKRYQAAMGGALPAGGVN